MMSYFSDFFLSIPRRLLRFYFGFDKWHISPLASRKYARGIIDYLNQAPKQNQLACLEIGCGLGDILRRVHFSKKYGLDVDRKVLNALRFVNRITFSKNLFVKQASFPEEKVTGAYDAIILVNWIHHLPSNLLKENVEELFGSNLHNHGLIILDTVQDSGYKYNHDIHFLTANLNCILERIGAYERQREVWAVKRND
jgi:2-polyprenyl-3-methyl-5-hydroxy-6-metoxy-1,4-benzoquinol methylase